MTEIELNERIEALLTANPDREKRSRSERPFRIRIKVQKDDRLLSIVRHGYIPHAGYVDWGFEGRTLLHSGKYIKYPRNSNCQRWMKRQTSKRVRRGADFSGKGNQYRKFFDYWWTLY